MADLTPIPIARAGVDLITSLVAADGAGETFANTGKEFLAVANASGSPIDVTITSNITVDGQDVADKTVTVADGETQLIGPFPKAIYNDDNDEVSVAYSDETDITVAVFSLTAGV